MKHFEFLQDLTPTPPANFWRLPEHEVPASPGVYFLVARRGVNFTYPRGLSPIFYIGQAGSLNQRLSRHLKHSISVRDRDEGDLSAYWPRYEYAGVYGGLYCFIRTWRGLTPKRLEDIVLRRFFAMYRAFPVANGAGSWIDS